MIVMKFGGSSVESAAAIERVAGIVRDRVDRHPVVVVSAMGKTTNKLLAMATEAAAGKRDAAREQLAALREFHAAEAGRITRTADRSAIDQIIESHFQELGAFAEELVQLGEFPPQYIDLVSSYGERLSSHVVALAFKYFGINATHADSRDVIITDRRHTQAAPLYPRTYAKLAARIKPRAEAGEVVVMGGFIGSTQDGFTTTLGRGGSDFTASIVGAGIGAEEIQIWTDVDGMLTCDPRIVPGGHRVKVMSFAEAAELAFFGAKVLHPATVIPAVEKNIPVLILNSRNPSNPGTRLVKDSVSCKNPVKSIACKTNVTMVNIISARMLFAHGFLKSIFDVFDKFQTSVDLVSTSEVSVSVTLDNTESLEKIREALAHIAEVNVFENQAVISLVGDAIRETSGLGARIFRAVEKVNVRMVSQGASMLNLSMVVDGADLKPAVEALHRELFADLDPEVFA